MAINLNSSPYFDDYDASKDFHQILFKPGFPVQSRELTQSQTIQQKQISRFGSHIFANGSRVNGGQITINDQVYSVKINNSSYLSSLIPGNYIVGAQSNMVGEVISVVTFEDSQYVVFSPRSNNGGTGSTKFNFTDNELVYVYKDSEQSILVSSTLTVGAGTSFNSIITNTANSSVITVTNIGDIKEGNYIVDFDSFVIGIDGNNITLNKPVSEANTNKQITVRNMNTTPTIMFGVSEGVFYIGGRFVQIQPQFIVPHPKNRWISSIIGLLEVQSIVNSDEDSSLLDPAQGSYNYTAPGADRLKVSLVLSSFDVDYTEQPEFIELLKVDKGVVIRQNTNTEYAELMKTIARRTYDESGNYVVNPFIINLKDKGDPDTITAVISPGKAYVNGYEFETITSTDITIDRARDTEQSIDFDTNCYVGNYYIINTISGAFPTAGTNIQFKNGATVLGTGTLLQISPSSVGVKMYVSNISGNVTTATSVLVGTMTANLVGGVNDISKQGTVFPLPQGYVKNAVNHNYTITRVYKNVSFNTGSATITALNTNERFGGGVGVLTAGVISANYIVANAGGATISGVNVLAVASGSNSQCGITLSNAAYNGTADVIATLDVTESSPRIKTLTDGVVNLGAVSANTVVSLKKSDLYKISFAANLTATQTLIGVWSAGSYSANNVVLYNEKLYVAANTTSSIPGTDADWSVLTDVTTTITSDNGQRDYWYDHATLKSSIAYTKLVVAFKYFKHAGNGPLTVDSYPIPVNEIPEYQIKNSGLVVALRDAIDMRMRRTDDNTASLSFDVSQVPVGTSFRSDVTYYLARIDKIVLTNDREFKVLKGVSSFNAPLPPSDISTAMTMATVMLPPYTDDMSIVGIRFSNNRRYTMKDINKLDTRLSNVEYYTSLNSIESSVINSKQYNPSGIELFHSGFVTDSFDSFLVGKVDDKEFRCSIDQEGKSCQPMFRSNSLRMVADTVLSNTKISKSLVTLPYTTKVLIKNVQPTNFVNINPFNVLGDIGVVKLSPSSDVWYDTVSLPQINIVNENTTSFQKAQEQASQFNASTVWGAWNTTFTGRVNYSWGYDTTTKQTAYKTNISVDTSIDVRDNTVVVSRETIPFARKNIIKFIAEGFPQNIELFCFSDNTNISNYVTPELNGLKNCIVGVTITNQGTGYTNAVITLSGGGGSGAVLTPVITNGKITSITVTNRGTGYTSNPTISITGNGAGAAATCSITVPTIGAPIITDKNGMCAGVINFPNDDKVKFPCGIHNITFADDSTNPKLAVVSANSLYTAEGYINTTQRTITSTKTPVMIFGALSKEKTTVTRTYYDPLAQSFYVDAEQTPNGIFVDNIDIYFASKDPAMPVVMELRPLVNGYPSSTTIIPDSIVVKASSDITTSNDGSIATNFKFTDPIYLAPGDYCIVLKTGSNKYNVFVTEMSKKVIGTNKVVSEQPYIGSLFESQNASTWTATQNRDLCFSVNVCQFDTTSTKSLILSNSEFDANIDLLYSMIQTIELSATKITASVELPAFSGIIPINVNVPLLSRNSITAANQAKMTIQFSSTDQFVSPVVDLERTALICIENIINTKSDWVTQETDPLNGDALAKYLTQKVTLNQGFNASNIAVYTAVNRPSGSSIEIYARVKNEFDPQPLEEKNWFLLNQEKNGGYTSQEDIFVEDKWSIYDYTYDSFSDFNQFQIKVVFISSNPALCPYIGDIRAIALA